MYMQHVAGLLPPCRVNRGVGNAGTVLQHSDM